MRHAQHAQRGVRQVNQGGAKADGGSRPESVPGSGTHTQERYRSHLCGDEAAEHKPGQECSHHEATVSRTEQGRLAIYREVAMGPDSG